MKSTKTGVTPTPIFRRYFFLKSLNGYDDLRVMTRVNGEVRQDDTTANILYDFSYLISYASTWNSLMPGDIISTGTPTGSGARMDPPQWLRAGDTVEVEVSGVGILTNPIENEV